ncbi:MAG: hypothetical protein IPH62_09605 [Ignavibacteriae bacterium]|nr:hypothetical protein [Ignavibacteriota bacterium]
MNYTKQNIIKYCSERIVVRKVFLVLFALYIVLAHPILQSYIICLESDGSVFLESVIDKQYCCGNTSSLLGDIEYLETNINEECNLCEDIAVSEICDNEYSFAVKKYQPLNTAIIIDFKNQIISSKEKKSTLITQRINYKSTQLDSYKTVLLLI